MRSNKQITLISKRLALYRRNQFGRNSEGQQGSMVVEASLIMPMFIFFVLFLIYMVQMTLVSTALQSTVSDTVKMVSTHIYPIALAIEQKAPENDKDGKEPVGSWSVPKLSLRDWAAQYTKTLPSPLNEWMNGAAAKADEPLQDLKNQVAEAVLDPIVKPILKPYMESKLLDYDRIHVSNIQIPNLRTRTDPYFGIEVSYELPMKVPFLGKKIVLQAKAQERLWIGETDANRTGNEGDSGAGNQAIEILEKPDPAYIAKRAKVRIKIAPGTSANLSVFYKSGQSTAKYLGEKQADSEGYIEWEWFVGTNTTPGTWPFVITTSDGQRTEVMFTVVKG
ncbi:pilus assembly protein [Paenibacillus sp.]|uniref:TadE/TadG family type IV pilus assembly protein n=1 Tax=Paenibacillus sp. TaxID=58172 RepID=UPI0028340B42|nr:pilus assembly protein [Paenibacillus sp.]MDR0269840.1 pilus assembly protein [Paenibacillus sp.]